MSKTILATVVLSFIVAAGIAAEEPMQHVTMTTTIADGPNQSVEKLHENEWTKLVQITMRNGATLAKHAAKEPVTIQCVSGTGTLVIGETRIPLTPGVIVPLDANIEHAVESSPAVSVLVTRFLTTGAKAEAHHH